MPLDELTVHHGASKQLRDFLESPQKPESRGSDMIFKGAAYGVVYQ